MEKEINKTDKVVKQEARTTTPYSEEDLKKLTESALRVLDKDFIKRGVVLVIEESDKSGFSILGGRRNISNIAILELILNALGISAMDAILHLAEINRLKKEISEKANEETIKNITKKENEA